MAESWNKKEREKKKQAAQKAKEERKRERRENTQGGKSLEDMLAYVDEDGNIVSTPPDPSKKKTIEAEDIVIGVPRQEDSGVPDYQREGMVSFFNDAKGFGFIIDKQNQQRVFFHASQLSEPVGMNDKVQFTIGKGPKGPEALAVKRIK